MQEKKVSSICIQLFMVVMILDSSALNAKEWIGITSAATSSPQSQLLSSDIQSSVIKFSISGFFKNEVTTQRGQAFFVTTNNASQILEAGAPDLPKFTESLIIPDYGTMKVEVTASAFQDFHDMEIAPSKGNLLRTINPGEIPFEYGSVYLKDEFFPAQIATLRIPYILRDFHGQTVVVNPFQYNPVTKVLRVYYSLTVRVYSDTLGVNIFNRNTTIEKADHEFASVYQQHFKNSLSVQYLSASENGSLLVICPQQWLNILQPLVDWKIQKGIPTEMIDVINAGGTAENIRDYIANYYSTHILTHVLLVGDNSQTPTLIASGGASDASYGYISGNDSYAEVFVGRFSAQTAAHVETQVDRTLNYEKYPDLSGSWYSKGVVVASNQGPGDDGEMDWEHAVNIRADLLTYTYTDVAELYDGTHPGTTDHTGDPNNIDLFDLLQDGVSIMSYTGHGSTTSFGTTGFSNSDILSLTNTNQLPFIWSVGCVNGDFQQTTGPCIGEEFLNAQYNGQPTGAIATMMSSVNQSWDPPMDAQDEMVDILVESYSNNIKRTFGGISVSGCMHMNDEYGLAGFAMTDTWICFGDPTLNVRTAAPQQITVTHPDTVTVGTSTLIVNCNHDGAFASLTLNGSIVSTGTVIGGMVQLNFQALNIVDTLTLTVSGFNLVPYITTVLVVPSSGPYVVYLSNNSHDVTGNSNGIIEYDEAVNVDLALQNLGLTNANNLSITLSTSDQYVNIINSGASLANILAGANNSIINAFSYMIAANIPDQHPIHFALTVNDSIGNSWSSSFIQVVNAPELMIGNLTINDSIGGNGNGVLEPGETGDIFIECFNNGHSDALPGFATLSTSSVYVTLNNASVNLNAIAAQTQSIVTFNISIASNLMFASPYDITCQLSAVTYFANKLFYRTAGENLEDFETNNFNKYGWGMMGNAPWFTTNYQPYQGTYCAQSGIISDGQASGLWLGVNVLADDSVSFWCKVSSEQDWDFLNYEVDNIKVDQWSGIVPWTFARYPINGGNHLIYFKYEKDQAISTGSDCAWLDNIKLPPGALLTSLNDVEADQNGIICYPNPVGSELNIAFNSRRDGESSFELFDLNGRLMKSNSFYSHQGLTSVQLSTSELNAGLFILRIKCNNQTFYKKIIVE